MNFFESQERARTHTLLLIVLFVMAVVILIVLTNLLLMLAMDLYYGDMATDSRPLIERINWHTFFLIGLGVSIVVLTGSISRIISLSNGGGKVIAESLGGQLIQRNTTDLKQRQLLNVVEEMAIASGTPAPPVYLLSGESAINAFAAGYTPRDAIIGVTEGLIDHLDRDQLQGVIAHEFSHIFNGDMRMNIHLIGVLNGILIIGRVGYEIISSPFRHRSSRVRFRSSNRGKGSGGAVAIVLATGLGLLIIGYTGVFFGNLIKAAVSRQREFLADASAVQFTRNPEGIAGALKKIGGLKSGSRVFSPSASDISHAFFASGLSRFMLSLWATHPPLAERIRRIDPAWDGSFTHSSKVHITTTSQDQKASQASESGSISSLSEVNHTIDHIGAPDWQTIQQAHQIINAIPYSLQRAGREPWGARALIYALLLDQEYAQRVKQLELLQYHADRDVYLLLQKIMNEVDTLSVRFRLPLIDLTLPSLKQLSNSQYQSFRDNVVKLAKMDSTVDLMEWSLQKILFNHLDQFFHNLPSTKIEFTKLKQLHHEITLLLTVMAYAGHQHPDKAGAAFERATQQLDFHQAKILSTDNISVSSLDRAVVRIQRLKPTRKQQLLKACATSIMFDRKITAREIELLRAFADALDCPIPMLGA